MSNICDITFGNLKHFYIGYFESLKSEQLEQSCVAQHQERDGIF